MADQRRHILVIDDDTRLRRLLYRYLTDNGFDVSEAADTMQAEQLFSLFSFDLLVMDVMMPGKTGTVFTKELRDRGFVTPILMLTAMGQVDDRISGLENGADDYLCKPFEPKELLLRIGSILKRTPTEKKETQKLDFGQCVFDMQTKELASKQGEIMHITPIEQSLLGILGAKSGQVFSRDKLSEILGAGQSPRSIDVQITRLRKKIEKDSKNPRYLQTVRGKGYMLLPD